MSKLRNILNRLDKLKEEDKSKFLLRNVKNRLNYSLVYYYKDLTRKLDKIYEDVYNIEEVKTLDKVNKELKW